MNVKGQVLSLKNVDEQDSAIGGDESFDEVESCGGKTACEVGNVKGGGYFPFGSMGVHSLGNGVFYFVEPDNSDLKNLSVNSVAYRLTEIDGTTRFVRFDEKA